MSNRGSNDVVYNNGVVVNIMPDSGISDKSKLSAALLCFFLGFLGVHRFYLGRVGSGIVLMVLCVSGVVIPMFGYILTFIGFLWIIVDFFCIIFGSLNDSDGKKLR